MANLASVVTKQYVITALERIIREKSSLTPATKYHLIYKGLTFPPKEVVRFAAREMGIKNFRTYSLVGGSPTNKYLEKMGFTIEQFNDWKVNSKNVPASIEKKISRIVWNTNGWQKPSGLQGKSKSTSYERENAYGHEEWLLDFTKLIDGYHYAFLEPINKYRETYAGKKFEILLYSSNSETNEKYFIGTIKNAICLDHQETREAIKTYRKRGWINEMFKDLRAVKADVDSLNEWLDETLFNIKFKPDDYVSLQEPLLIFEPEKYITSARYNLLNRTFEIADLKEFSGEFVLGNSDKKRGLKSSAIRRQEPKTIQLPLLHNKISEGLEKELSKKYKIVVPENKTGYGTSIDMVAKSREGFYFYEIKSYDHILTCIRMALGQIIEYSYYPNRTLAKKLFIVSQHEAKDKHIRYIEHLRKTLKLPLYYIWFDLESNKIKQEI